MKLVETNLWTLFPFSTVVHLACNSFGWPTHLVATALVAICKSGPPVLRSWLACSGIPGFPVNLCSGRHWCTHHCAPCLSDNLHRATGQCLRDIWPQQQRQRSTGRLFSRSVTTERRFRWSLRAACSRSPSRLQPSVASRGWPGEHQHQSPLGAPPCEPCNGQSVTNK